MSIYWKPVWKSTLQTILTVTFISWDLCFIFNAKTYCFIVLENKQTKKEIRKKL